MHPTDRRPDRSWKALAALVLVLLTCAAMRRDVRLIRAAPAIDFVQYWALANATDSAGRHLHPYRETDAVADWLAQRKDDPDPLLRQATMARAHWFQGIVSPLLILACRALPADYAAARTCFHFAGLALFFLAIANLARRTRSSRLLLALFGVTLLLTFAPLLNNFEVGNVGTFQLAFFVAIWSLLDRRRDPAVRPHRLVDGALLALLPIVTLAKPNLVPLALAFALAALAPVATRAATLLALSGGALVGLLLPIVWYSDLRIWGEFLRSVTDLQPWNLPEVHGNLALRRLLESRWGFPSLASFAAVAAALLTTAGVLASQSRPRRRLADLLREPDRLLAAGTAVTFALSPLVWVHYGVLLLAPATLALVRGGGAAKVLGALAVLLASSQLDDLAAGGPGSATAAVLRASAWLPLWLAAFAPAADEIPLSG